MKANINKILTLVLLLIIGLSLSACSEEENSKLTLRIYNWQDYIDEGLDEDGEVIGTSVCDDWAQWYFEKYGKEVEVVYDTFETNEVMLNTLKTGKTTYDLICPSDYTIQKMIRLDMLEKIDYDLKDSDGNNIMTNIDYVSKYLVDLFDTKGFGEYSVPYMWGTMGFIYDPENIDPEDITNWSILWDKNYKNMATAKDSVRDTYVVGVMYVYYEELMALKKEYDDGNITMLEYNTELGKIMNRCDDETLDKVKKALNEMKKNLYGFEVDSGKSDIVTGKVSINFAWSGDAVYSMDIAEDEEEIYLNYIVPEEGSNVWFDGWVMPKGANKELAQSFINYLCDPEVAVRNMNVIGYTSSVVGEAILDMIIDWYGPSEPYFDEELGYFVLDDEEYEELTDENLEVIDKDGIWYIGEYNTEIEVDYGYEVDLTYLFAGSVESDSAYLTDDNKIVVTISERGRQFDAQYPDEETIARCGIMEDFGDQNDAVLEMWESIKIGDIPIYITIVLISVIVIGIAALYGSKFYKKYQRAKRREIFKSEMK